MVHKTILAAIAHCCSAIVYHHSAITQPLSIATQPSSTATQPLSTSTQPSSTTTQAVSCQQSLDKSDEQSLSMQDATDGTAGDPWCYCRKDESVDYMIGCDNPACMIQWLLQKG